MSCSAPHIVLKSVKRGDYFVMVTETTEKNVLFDPGFAQHTTILSLSLNYIYSEINSFKNFGQRKIKFKMSYPQIIRMTDNNVGFCLGSLLWAVYIKSLGDLKIEGNPCLGDIFNKEETVEEADFSIKYFDQLQKDSKYYLNSNYNINPTHIKILELYKEFLVENKNFVSTKTTNDIILPEGIKIPDSNGIESIHSKIQEVIKTGKLLDLLEVFGLIYG